MADIRLAPTAIPGPPGPPGATGPAGPAGQGVSYVHDQGVPSGSWEVVHNLDKFPGVEVVDSSGRVVRGAITYVNDDTIILDFNAPFTGKAYLN